MNEPLDRHNLVEPTLISRMIGLGTITGLGWGICLGAAYGFIIGLIDGHIVLGIIAAVVGAVFGAIYGLVLGSLHGLILGLVTTFYFSPLSNERIYRGAMAVTSVLVNIGVGCFLVSYFGGFDSVWSELRFFFVWPFPIATAASLKGSQLFAQWYIDGRFRRAAKSVDHQADEPVTS